MMQIPLFVRDTCAFSRLFSVMEFWFKTFFLCNHFVPTPGIIL